MASQAQAWLIVVPHIPKRPPALAHLSDEQAARALSKHFGSIVDAARELNVDRRDLRRLTWNNPQILDAAHERMAIFALRRRDEIMGMLNSSVGSVRRRAIDIMHANPALFGDLDWPLRPAVRSRGPRRLALAVDKVDEADEADRAREQLEQAALAERSFEAEREREAELAREREAEAERARDRVEVVVALRPPAPASMAGWGAYVRRPTRGRRR